jgi:hypothetical protein
VTAAADRDLLIGQALGRVEDQPRSLHDPKRQRQRGRPTLKLNAILLAKPDPEAARPRHDSQFAARQPLPSHNSTNFRTRPLARTLIEHDLVDELR